jgi:phospholipid transport system substrate-binding protein
MIIKNLFFIFLLLTSNITLAQSPSHYPNPNLQQSPSKILNYGVQRLRSFMETQKPTKDQLRAFIENELVQYFDFDYMVKWASGKYYRSLDSYQKEQVTDTIKEMFFSTLVKSISGKKLPEIRFLRERAGHYSNELNVIALIKQNGNNRPLKITFRLYKSAQGWKVFDVKAGGRSAILFYRNYLKKMFTKMQSENLL